MIDPQMIDTRQIAHQLIDRLPETQLSGLVLFLETIVDPVPTALRAEAMRRLGLE